MRVIVVIFAFLLPGCGIRDAIRKKSHQIDAIELSNKRIEKRLLKIDSLSQEQKKFLTLMKAEAITNIRKLDNKISALESRLGDLERLLYKKTTPSGSTKVDSLRKAQDIYNIAYSDFLKGNYELSIAGFRQFLSEFKDIDNAYYWIGECYYAMKDYPKAIEVFKNVAFNYPMSPKAPAALYKLITIYNISQDSVNVKKYLAKLIETYPNSPEAKLLKKTVSEKGKSNK